ncbi:MAG: sigma-70 family RNA polymerase sigma factor, partial [Betaproteobacteria bacterium]
CDVSLHQPERPRHPRTISPVTRTPSKIDKLWSAWQETGGHPEQTKAVRAPSLAREPALERRMRGLLAAVAAGDQSAYADLYGLLSHSLRGFVRRMIATPQMVDEVVVDTMYEVWRSAGRFRGESLVSTWVLGIARNKALMALRHSPSPPHEDIDDFSEVLDACVPDGFTLLARKQASAVIHSCLRKLSDKHRECIHLAYFEDLSIAAIATILDIPEGTVKSRLSEARAQLAMRVSRLITRGGVQPGCAAVAAN